MSLMLLIKSFIIKYGAISVCIIIFLEYSCLPISSEFILPFVGLLAKNTHQNIYYLTFMAVLGGTLGSILVYLIGRFFGSSLVDKLSKKYPSIKGSIEKSKAFLTKYQYIGICLSRTLPVGRTTSSIVAGMIKMRFTEFFLCSTVAMSAWSFFLIDLGSLFQKDKELLRLLIKKYFLAFFIIVVLALILFLFIKKWRKKEI